MTLKAAFFDVDGTLVKGNCTKIFLDYLFEKDMIHKEDYILFKRKYKYLPGGEIANLEMIGDALKLFSVLSLESLRNQWNNCFETRIRNNFNPSVLSKMNECRDAGLEIFLASGSHAELVSLIGRALNIDENHVIATETEHAADHFSAIPLPPVCYKEGKKERVITRLNQACIDMEEICFFSDNLSDVELLSLAGEGYWTGSPETYESHSLDKKGIKKAASVTKLKHGTILMDDILWDYYNANRTFLEESVYEIIPKDCNSGSMEVLAGKAELTWDYATLQRYFFDPVNKYLEKRPVKAFCLGSLLFLEAAGIDPERYKSLVGIAELLDISHEMFTDIKRWTSIENEQVHDKTPLEISIVGNVSIALITAASHTLISNRPGLEEHTQHALICNFVTSGYESLFGNGLQLYWEQNHQSFPGTEKYERVACLKRRFLQIPCIFWILLQQKEPVLSDRVKINSFMDDLSIAFQYHKDLQEVDLSLPSGSGSGLSAFLSEKYEEFRERAFRALEKLPMDERYMELIKSYCIYIADR